MQVSSFDHVEGDVCAGRLAACLPMWIQSSSATRLLRIVLDGRRRDSDVRWRRRHSPPQQARTGGPRRDSQAGIRLRTSN